MSSYLPCGVTDRMCEPDDPSCGSCGHLYSEHYYKDGEDQLIESELLTRSIYPDGYHASGYEYNSNGEVVSACDMINCGCEEYIEGEYEPEYDDYRWDRD